MTGTAGGGMVTATSSGSGELKAVKIDPQAVDPEDVELLEDMVVAAVAEAKTSRRRAASSSSMGAVTRGIKLPGLLGPTCLLTPAAENLVRELARLPGVGRRTAQRLAFHLLKALARRRAWRWPTRSAR